MHFALWTKNPWIIEDAFDASERKPSNLQIIYSSPCINDQADPGYDFIDKIFTVYDKNNNAIQTQKGNLKTSKKYDNRDRIISERLALSI